MWGGHSCPPLLTLSLFSIVKLRSQSPSRIMDSQTDSPIDLSIAPESASSHATADREAAVLTADLALARIADRDLSSEVLEQISKNTAAMKSRKVRLALAAHPRAPRRIALRLIRELYTFDLMQFSLLPVVAADLKRVADELLAGRLASISLGERSRRLTARPRNARVADRLGESASHGIQCCQSLAKPDRVTSFRQSSLPSS